LLVLTFQSLDSLILSCDTDIKEEVRGVFRFHLLHVQHRDRTVGNLCHVIMDVDCFLNSIVIDHANEIVGEPLKLLSNQCNIFAVARVHESTRYLTVIILVKSLLDYETVFILVEIKVVL
jgi:hypothetical protein